MPKLNLICVDNPFDRRNQTFTTLEYKNQSILDLRNSQFPLDVSVDISINGHLTKKEDWAFIFPKENDHILFVPQVHGGGGGGSGKLVLRAVLMIALTVVSFGIGTAVSFGAMGFGAANWFAAGYWSTAGLLAANAAFIVGGMLINSLLAPKPGKDAENSPTFSWNPQTTQQQGIPIPRVYGVNKLRGNVLAGWRTNISETRANAVINVLMGMGLGPLKNLYGFEINDQKISDLFTPDTQIETRLGNVQQPLIDNFNDTVVEKPATVKITFAGGPYTYTTTSNDFDKLSVLIGFTSLFSVDSKGGQNANTANLRVSIRRILNQGGSPVSEPWRSISTTTGRFLVTVGRWSLGYWVTEWEQGTSHWVEYQSGSTDRNAYYEGQKVTNPNYYGEDNYYIPRFYTWRWVETQQYVNNHTLDYAIVTRNINSPFMLNYDFVPAQKGTYEIKVERLFDDFQDSRHYSEFYFSGVKEFFYDDFSYPRIALVGIKAVAQDRLSGSLNFSCMTDGSIIHVYDGSNWTFTNSNNPAWVAWDILTQPVIVNTNGDSGQFGPFSIARYDGIHPDNLDLQKFKEWADYCDVLVPDGKGGLEKRCVFNGIYDSESNMWEAVIDVMSVGRAVPGWWGTKITVIVDKLWDKPKYLYSMGNVGVNSFKENFLPFVDRTSELEVEFINSENNYNKDRFTVINPNIKTKTNKVSMSLLGVTRPSEVWRHAMFRLKQNELLLRTIEWRADIDSIASSVGDVVNFQHDIPQWGYGGRIVSATATVVTLDREIEMEAGQNYTILITLEDDSTVERSVVTVPGVHTEITVSSPFNTIPKQYNVYAFGKSNFHVKPVRIIGIKRETDQTAIITGLDYNETLYNVDTGGPVLPTINYSDLNTLPSVRNLRVTERLVKLTGGSIITVLDVSFDRPLNGMARSFDIYIRQRTGTQVSGWAFVTSTPFVEYTITNNINDLQTYQIAVVTENLAGQKQLPNNIGFVEITPLGKTVKPENVSGFSYSINKHGVVFRWDSVSDIDIDGYEIRENLSFGNVDFLQYTSELTWTWPFRISGSYNIYIKAKDTSGNYSENVSVLNVEILKPAVPNVSYSFSGSDVIILWNDSTTHFAVDYYRVYSDDGDITTVKGTTYRQKVNWGGSRRIYVSAVDIAGNEGNAGYADVLIISPGVIQSPTVQVIDNNVLMKWSKPISGNLPIERYEVRKGPVYSVAAVIGSVDGTFSVVFETEAGQYNYWIVAVDTAGNYGIENGFSAIVNQPPDYILRQNWVSNFETKGFIGDIGFTRASNAYHPENWSLKVNNVPRYKDGGGIFLEEGTTNLILHSNDYLNAVWTPQNFKNITPNHSLIFNGLVAGHLIVDNRSDGLNGILQSVSIPTNTTDTYVVSIGVKKTTGGTSSTFGINLSTTGIAATVSRFGRINTDTGAIGGSAASFFSVEDHGDTWKVIGNITNGGNNLLNVGIYPATNTHGIYTDNIAAQGQAIIGPIMVERRIFPTSYVASTTTSGVRAPEVLTLDNVGSPVVSDTTKFSVEFDVFIAPVVKSRTSVIFKLAENSSTGNDLLLYHNSNTSWILLWRNSGVSYSHNIATNLIPDGLQRLAVVKDGNTISVWCQNTKIFENTSASTMRSSFNILEVGHSSTLFQLGTYIKALKISSRALNNDQITNTGSRLITDEWTTALYNFDNSLSGYKGLGAMINCFKESNHLVIPVNTNETWEQHFTVNNWQNSEEKVNSGNPIHIQPTPNSADYSEIFDYGTILPGTMVSTSYLRENISGNPIIKTDLSVSEDKQNWTVYNEVTQVFATNFRYVKVRIYIESSLPTDIVKISDLTVRLDVKQKTDSISGPILNSSGDGDEFFFGVNFIDIISISPSAPFINDPTKDPLVCVVDFVDTPFPSSFKAYLYDKNGNRMVTPPGKKVSFIVTGV